MKYPFAFVLPLGVLAFFVAHFHSQSSHGDEAAGALDKDAPGVPPVSRGATDAAASSEAWVPLQSARTSRRGRLASAPNGNAWVSPAEASGMKAKAEWHEIQHHPLVGPEFAALGLDEQIESLPPAFRNRAERYRRDLGTLDRGKRRYVCFAPGTNPEVVMTFRNIEREGGLVPGEMRTQAGQFLGSGHWDRTAIDGPDNDIQGLPVTLTWSIMPDGSDGPELDGGERLSTDLREWLTGIYGVSPSPLAEDQPWFPIFEAAFEALSVETGLTFVYQPNDDGAPMSSENPGNESRGDIRIGAHEIDGNSGILAFAFAPDFGDVIFDSTDNFFNESGNDSIRLFNVLTHEIGHALGLAHVCPINETKLMEPFVSTEFRGPQYDDIFSLQRQYGDFLEAALPDERDNDTTERATMLDPIPDEILSMNRLSIDGPNDVDFFRVRLTANDRLSTRANPSNPFPVGTTYLEGPQPDDEDCSDGVPFNPTNLQNLEVALFDSDGETILVSAEDNPAGQREDIFNFVVPETGDYFVRVQGDGADNAQLYELQVFLSTAPTPPGIDLDAIRVVEESNRPANFSADPGETVRLELTLTNNGNLPVSNLRVEPEAVAGLTDFTNFAQSLDLLPGESGDWIITFAQDTACRDLIDYTLNLTAEGEFSDTVNLPVEFATVVAGGLIDETFDTSNRLPSGWQTQTVGAARRWVSSDKRPDEGGRSAVVEPTERVGESMLISPVRAVGPEGGTLSFRHWYDLEDGFDGARLEFSLDGGPWEDLILHPDVALTGQGYNRVMNSNFESPIADREAWSGRTGDYVPVSVELPMEWARLPVQFRWVLATDINVTRLGWHVDSVVFDTEGLDCLDFRPALSLDAESGALTRGEPGQAMLRTPLPLSRDITVELEVSGDFTALDLASPVEVVLPAGETEVAFPVEVALGSASTGESLVLGLSADSSEFAAESPSSLSFALTAPQSGFGVWSARFPGLSADPLADDDGNGFANLIEYAFDTNPLDPASKPVITRQLDDSRLELRLPAVPDDRTDLVVGAETSTDLIDWSEDGISTTEDGFAVPRSGPNRFLRLKIDLVTEPSS